MENRLAAFLNESSEIPQDQHENAKGVFNCLMNYYRFVYMYYHQFMVHSSPKYAEIWELTRVTIFYEMYNWLLGS